MMKLDTAGVFQLKKADNGVHYLHVPDLEANCPVRIFFTTRVGGVSAGPYDSLNFGKYTDDDPANIIINRKKVFAALDIDDPVMIFPRQVHGDAIACIRAEDIAGSNNITFEDTDAVITKLRHVILTTVHADCLPVYLADTKNCVIGLAHAGWRGTRDSITEKTIDQMIGQLGAERGHITAVIGPGVDYCCFDVGGEVYREFSKEFDYIDEYSYLKEDGKYMLDLKSINSRQLSDAGITDIRVTGYCTCCEGELFFSHRRDHGVTGRMGAGISLL